jgi:iron complex outermembrane receptor protein
MTRRTLLLIAAATAAMAQQAPAPSAVVQVTATRFPEEAAKVPASVTVITGDELRDRGATDLRTALSLAAGIHIAPGADGGPASSVPEMWGLREADAFLLVVDGVPWGGTFNPALSTLDLENVERIEIQRGSAPVMYGATSFVGVIHVIHKLPADATGSARAWLGTHSSGGASATLKLPSWAGFASSLTVEGAKQGYADPRTEYQRGALNWRNLATLGSGVLRFDVNGAWVNQKPGSPVPRVGKGLATDIPLDANHNMADAYLHDRRVGVTLGYDHTFGAMTWSTTLAYNENVQNYLRGFLVDDTTDSPNAHGFRAATHTSELFLDSHFAWSGSKEWKVVVGVDHMQGQGTGRGGDFDYDIDLDGGHAPQPSTLPNQADVRIDDHRSFSGLYAFAEFEPAEGWVLEGGVRLNHTEENRRAWTWDFASGVGDGGSDRKTFDKLSGSLGLTWTFYQSGKDRVSLFADYRNTFKPAAIDFGLDSTDQILAPETAQSYELGFKGQFFDGRVSAEVAAFRMLMINLVVSNSVSGSPVLANAGQERFQGIEASLALKLASDLSLRAAYSNHDSRFTDSVQDFGGTPTQLRGNRLEMTPYQLAGLGLVYAPKTGFVGTLEGNYNGWVYLNKRNTVPSGGYSTLAASAGWRFATWEVRVSGTNLTDKRVPVTESELGDAQYYRLPARQVNASVRFTF